HTARHVPANRRDRGRRAHAGEAIGAGAESKQGGSAAPRTMLNKLSAAPPPKLSIRGRRRWYRGQRPRLQRELFRAQRLNRVYQTRAARWEQTCDQCGQSEDRQCRREQQRIVGGSFVKERL